MTTWCPTADSPRFSSQRHPDRRTGGTRQRLVSKLWCLVCGETKLGHRECSSCVSIGRIRSAYCLSLCVTKWAMGGQGRLTGNRVPLRGSKWRMTLGPPPKNPTNNPWTREDSQGKMWTNRARWTWAMGTSYWTSCQSEGLVTSFHTVNWRILYRRDSSQLDPEELNWMNFLHLSLRGCCKSKKRASLNVSFVLRSLTQFQPFRRFSCDKKSSWGRVKRRVPNDFFHLTKFFGNCL